MMRPELLWWDSGSVLQSFGRQNLDRAFLLSFQAPWPSEQEVLGWLVRSLHSLISELIAMKTHRQQ